MKTFNTYAEYLEACTERTANSYRPPVTPYKWTCETCGKVSPHSTPYGLGDRGTSMRCYDCCHSHDIACMCARVTPFGAYLSSDGKSVSNWPGGILGTVTYSSTSRTGWHGTELTHVRVTDVHGGKWYGKGAGRGMCITLRACKS